MIDGTQAIVSTLWISVGLRHRPSATGNGGLCRGMPRLPSSASSSAVSSPQMYAPLPSCMWNLMSPNTPDSWISSIIRSTIPHGTSNSPRR